jgi:DNA polymerase
VTLQQELRSTTAIPKRWRILHLDWETRSKLDLTKVGAHKYARHPSTHVLCGGYSIRWNDEPFEPSDVRMWRTWAGEEMPDDLYEALTDPTVVIEAWNAQFERLIAAEMFRRWTLEEDIDDLWADYQNVLMVSRWHCTAARARACALPGKLDLCARFLQVPMQKSDSAAMKRWMAPQADGTWWSDEQDYEILVAYCAQDVRAEGDIGSVIRDLTPIEWEDYFVNEKLNDRGIPVDVELAIAAQHYAADEEKAIRKELSKLTCGRVQEQLKECTHENCGAIRTPRQHAKLKEWVLPRVNAYVRELMTSTDGKTGKEKISLDKATRTSILEDEDVLATLSDEVITVLELIDDAGRSSIAKFKSIVEREIDGRVYGCYIMNGAGQTGRYSAVGFQPHNLPVRERISNTEDVVDLIKAKAPVAEITLKSGKNILTTLSCLLRAVIVAENGKVLRWRDYSSVEARALPWLADDPAAEEIIQAFFNGDDVYIKVAAGIYGVNEAELLARYKSGDPEANHMRQVGKVAVLSLGFGGGAGALKKMARAYGIKLDDATAEFIKRMWRRANPWAERFWKRLHVAACNAARSPGVVYTAGRVQYMRQGSDLWCLLPCGRIICYPDVRVTTKETKWGTENVLTAAKGSWQPKKGQIDWPRHTLWHGILAENVTQGICASLLRAANRLLEEWEWPLTMHTHDEDLLEIDEAEADEADSALEAAMLFDHGWNQGMPLACEPSGGIVYGKG